MIGALVSLFNGGLETYRQYNRNKAEALKRKNELDMEKHQVSALKRQRFHTERDGRCPAYNRYIKLCAHYVLLCSMELVSH